MNRKRIGGVAIGGIYCQDSKRFNRGILPNLSRCLKSDTHDACVVIVYETDTDNRKQKRDY